MKKSIFYLWILFDWKKRWRKIYSQGGDGRSNFRYKSHLSKKETNPISLKKEANPISEKKSYKSYLSNISKKCPSWKICKSYLLKEIQTLSNKETNSISWKDKQIQKLSNKETDSFSWKDTIWEKRRNLNLSQNNEQLFFSPSCLSYLSIEMCPWSQEIVVSRPID